MTIGSGIKKAFLLGCCFCALSACAADAINGTVRNQTSGKVAAGDEVILLRLQNGMEEEAKTRADAAGAFSLPLSAADLPHIVRVVHQGVNYDQTASGKGPLNIAVFDAVPHIRDLQGTLGIAQVESDGEMLKVTEMYSIANDSVPPVTQAGPRNFEISIAPQATLDSLVVKKGGGVWVNLTPTPIKGQQGRYVVDFPIRPGATLFKFVYHLPYSEPTRLQVKVPYSIRNFAVMHPPSMLFNPSSAAAFTSPGVAQGLRVEQAVGKPVVREVAAFDISGIGLAAPTQAAAASPATSSPALKPETPAAVTLPAVPGRQENSTWILFTGLAALLTAIVYVIWKKRKRTV
ncbi:MAG TPA: LPXTG cell wall anchor domain-containing protein [Candidatus Angelobacter sp.]|nr:LPXTG cell wall anchor domain-containing protein [Candidatus Angelobacter sp.]